LIARLNQKDNRARLAGMFDLVCFVYLVNLVYFGSFAPPNNQIDQTNQIMAFSGWRLFSILLRGISPHTR
jgi:hypothetical protein